jgi:hypothetical protein
VRNVGFIVGITAISILEGCANGRTTIFLLQMNEPSRLQLRQALATQGLYPDLPPDIQIF